MKKIVSFTVNHDKLKKVCTFPVCILCGRKTTQSFETIKKQQICLMLL